LEETTADPAALKTQRTLLLIVREMVQTERDYVRALEYIIEVSGSWCFFLECVADTIAFVWQNYLPELLREDIPQALRGQRNVIFGNFEKIFEFHGQFFLKELEKCEQRPLSVAHCFLRHVSLFLQIFSGI
jgi:pleckstrin homology domain-containing family G member 4